MTPRFTGENCGTAELSGDESGRRRAMAPKIYTRDALTDIITGAAQWTLYPDKSIDGLV